MSFLLYVAVGFFSGLLGGMGMGGGTILIPALTIFLGVEQHIAQATNLISFLPMAAFSLNVHKKQGLLVKNGTPYIIIPAVITSVLGGFVAAFLPAIVLKKLFGAFLIALAVKQTVKLINGF
jgi:hypothetical protein